MAENDESKASAPYGSFGTFWNFLGNLKAETLPPQIDRSMMRGKSGTDQQVINMALKFFELVDPADNNAVLPSLKALVAADPERRKQILGELVRQFYADQMEVSEQHGTEKNLHDSFMQAHPGSADTRRKAATFFLHAASMAGITVSPNFPKARTGQNRPASGAVKKPTPRKKAAVRKGTPQGEASGGTYTITLESGGTVTLIVNADLMAIFRNDNDRTFVTALIDKMESYDDAEAAVDADPDDEEDP